MLFILAGCRAHARHFANQRNLNPKQWVYLYSVDQTKGIRYPAIICLTSYHTTQLKTVVEQHKRNELEAGIRCLQVAIVEITDE